MIGIRIGDEFCDVPGDVKIPVFLNNPLLNEDNLSPGSGSLPFDLPGDDDSPHNAQLLGNPDVLENADGLRKFDSELQVDNIPFKKGNLIVRDARPGKISTNFNFGLGTLSDEFKTKKVRDIIAATITIDSSNFPKKIYLKAGTLATNPYSINVNGRTYSETSVSNLAAAINADTSEPRATATYVTSGTTPYGLSQPFIELAPYNNPNDPLSPLHVDVAEDNGNSSTGYVWAVEGMDLTSYWAAFNTYLDGYATEPYASDAIRWPIVFNDNLYGEGVFNGLNVVTVTKSTNYVNARTTGGIVVNSPNRGLAINVPFVVNNANSLQPFLRMKWVLDQIADYFGFTWEGDWFDTDVTNMLIDNAAPLDVPQDYIGKTKFVFWNRVFTMESLIEDITVIDLFKSLQNRYNLGIYQNERTGRVRVVKRESVALQVSDVDLTPQAGKINGRSDMRITGFTLRSVKDDNDGLSTVDEYVVGESEQVIETKISGLAGDITTTINGGAGDVTGPHKSQPMTNKFPLRVFYYKGLIDNGTFTYPKASADAFNYDERFDGVGGLYAHRWKYWLYFAMRRRAITLPVAFFYSQLQYFDWEILQRLDRKQFIVKSISADVTNSGIMVSEVELWTMF